MIINFLNYNVYAIDNDKYNHSAIRVIENIMQAETVGKIGYKLSKASSFFSTRRHRYHRSSSNQTNEAHIRDAYSNYSKLGPLEYGFASYLFDDSCGSNVIILSGALGSGKSSLIEYVLNYLSSGELSEDDLFYVSQSDVFPIIDFNNIDEGKTTEVLNEFKKILTNQLIGLIEEIHNNVTFIDEFIKKISTSKNLKYQEFHVFKRLLSKRSDCITEQSRFDLLLDSLETYNDDLSYKLRLLSFILAFIGDRKNVLSKANFFIVFDNIDKLDDLAQIEILSSIFSFAKKVPKITIVVPMRLTTLGKIKGNGSYTFNIFENSGQIPLEIVEDRIFHFLDNLNSYKHFTNMPAEYKTHLIQKMNHLSLILKSRKDARRLSKVFNSIAGDSIRRGLYLAERLFLNSVIYYKGQNIPIDEFSRALLVGRNFNGKIDNEDRIVCNVFAGFNSKNSLLNVRILQIVSYLRNHNLPCTIAIIQRQLSSLNEYPQEDLLHAINTLLYVSRKLVCIDGVGSYSDSANFSKSLYDIVQLTHTGTEYLSNLIFDAVYLQTTFMSLEWVIPSTLKSFNYLQIYIDKINDHTNNKAIKYLLDIIENRKAVIKDFISDVYDFKDINERMKFIRDCLYLLLLCDLDELARYYGNNADEKEFIENKYIQDSILIEIIAKVSINILNILKSNRVNNDEIANWFEFLNIADLWQNGFFQCESQILNRSIRTYKSFIENQKKFEGKL